MNCRTAQRQIAAALPGVEERPVLEHLARCERCRRFAGRWRAATERLAERPVPVEPDAGFAARVAAALPAGAEPLAWAARRLVPAAVALALALLGWCWVATPLPGELLDSASNPTDDVLILLAQTAEDGG
jgi:hypothetical protein